MGEIPIFFIFQQNSGAQARQSLKDGKGITIEDLRAKYAG